MDWLTVDVGLLAASVALVLATAVLAVFTWRLWQETRAGRQPLVVASLDLIVPQYGELRIANAGVGAALEVEITFGFDGGERRWTESVLLPGDGRNFNLLSPSQEKENPRAKNLDHIIELFDVMRVDGTYKDVRGKRYKVEQAINIRSQWTEAIGSYQLAGFRGPLLPLYNVLDSIKKSLEKIAGQK